MIPYVSIPDSSWFLNVLAEKWFELCSKSPVGISKEVATIECDSPLIYQPEMSGHLGMIPLIILPVRSQWGRSEVGVRSQWGRCIIYPIDELNTAELFTDYHILP